MEIFAGVVLAVVLMAVLGVVFEIPVEDCIVLLAIALVCGLLIPALVGAR